MLSRDAEMILKRYKRFFDAFEKFDRTGEFPLEKIRRSFTITRGSYHKLKAEAARRRISMSELIDRMIEGESRKTSGI